MGNLVKNTAFNQFKCFRPRVIANKYTGELVTIRCGHCEACRLARSNERTSKLERVREVAKCTFFGTLTYADDFLPVMNFDNRGYDIPLDNEYNQVHGTFFVKKALVGSYYRRQKYNRSPSWPSCCFVNIYDHELLDPVNLNELNSYEKDLIRNGYHTVGKANDIP